MTGTPIRSEFSDQNDHGVKPAASPETTAQRARLRIDGRRDTIFRDFGRLQHGKFPTSFAVHYHNRIAETTLPAESVGTYVW